MSATPASGGDGLEVVRRVLAHRTWAVVGLRDNPARAAYRVARFLQGKGRRIVPVHPRAQDVHGETAYATLADIPFPVDVVDVFVNSSLAGDIADQAVAVGARAVWFQLDGQPVSTWSWTGARSSSGGPPLPEREDLRGTSWTYVAAGLPC